MQSKKLDLPSGVNALNFAWLPGTPGKETEKLVVLTDEERSACSRTKVRS